MKNVKFFNVLGGNFTPPPPPPAVLAGKGFGLVGALLLSAIVLACAFASCGGAASLGKEDGSDKESVEGGTSVGSGPNGEGGSSGVWSTAGGKSNIVGTFPKTTGASNTLTIGSDCSFKIVTAGASFTGIIDGDGKLSGQFKLNETIPLTGTAELTMAYGYPAIKVSVDLGFESMNNLIGGTFFLNLDVTTMVGNWDNPHAQTLTIGNNGSFTIEKVGVATFTGTVTSDGKLRGKMKANGGSAEVDLTGTAIAYPMSNASPTIHVSVDSSVPLIKNCFDGYFYKK